MGGMTTAAAPADEARRDAEYEQHREAVMRMLARRFPRFAADERLEIYHEAWAWVLRKRGRGEQIDDLGAYLSKTASCEAMRIVADRRRPEPTDPENLVALPDAGQGPGERVLVEDQVRICREVIASLDGHHRDVFKLRYDVQLAPPEICAAMGITPRQYKRFLKQSTAAIQERVLELDDGTWSRRQRSLLAACLHDMASDEQRAEAQRRLAADPHVAALYRELRESIGQAAALLPLPAFAGSGADGGRIAAALDGAREGIAGLLGGAKQHATSAYVRTVDTTPIAGARPGAVAAAVTGCIAFGGGTATYCAVEGIPDAIRAPLGIEKPAEDKRAEASPAPVETVPFVAPVDQSTGAEATPSEAEAAKSKPDPEPVPVPAAAADTSNSGEFGTEQSSASSAGAGAYSSSPQPAPAPPAPGGDLGFEE